MDVTSGFESVLNCLKDGREGLYRLEHAGWQLQDVAAATAGSGPPWLRPLAVELLMRFPRYSVASPAAYLFARSAVGGASVLEIGHASALTPDEARDAACELRDNFGLLYLRQE